MSLEKVMLTELVFVNPLDSLEHVAQLFDARETHHVLVMAENRLVGIISDRDVLKAIHPNTFTDIASNTELKVLNKTANQVMTPKPICIGKRRSIVSASEIMLERNISALPVVDEQEQVIGLVSLKGIVRYFVSRVKERVK